MEEHRHQLGGTAISAQTNAGDAPSWEKRPQVDQENQLKNKGRSKWGRIADSDEEGADHERLSLLDSDDEPTKETVINRPKFTDPLGIWSDEEEGAGAGGSESDDDDRNDDDDDDEQEVADELGSGTASTSSSIASPVLRKERVDLSPEIPGPASLDKHFGLNSASAGKASSPREIIDLDSDEEELKIKFPIPRPSMATAPVAAPRQDTAPAFPVPQPALPPRVQPRPHPMFDPEYKAEPYNNAQFKPPSQGPKVRILSYDDPILQKQDRIYSRPEVTTNGFMTKAANPIAVPTNNVGENFGPLYAGVEDPFEPKLTPAQVEEQLKELVGHALEEIKDEVEEDEKIVEGFEPGFELLDHQVLARRWMRDRETGKKMGGILADDMGLGKTIQMLARISDGLPSKENRKEGWAKSTLVVCPVGLMDQWEREIAKFAPWMRVVQHHGAARASNPAVLERNHVVITSYNIVSNEYAIFNPDAKSNSKAKTSITKKKIVADDDDDDIGKYLEKRKAPATKKTKKLCALFEVQWWRIVLDEAHNIKNRATKMSIATCNLPGKYRWALTGTPLQNNVEELFPLLKFLRIRPLNDWIEYKQAIADPVKKGRTKSAMKRLHVILKAVMLRRTKAAIVNGKPILQLPARNVQVVPCEFDEDEQAFYEALASKVALTFNKYLRNGEVMKNYTSVLTLLLRLRQACNHPTLVSKDFAIDADALESTPADNKDDDGGLAAALAGLTVATRGTCQVCMVELDEDNHNKDSTRCRACDETVIAETKRKSMKRDGSSLPPSSSKIRKIVDLLEDILDKVPLEGEAPEKVIIFSQFTSFLDLLEPFLRDEHIKFVRVDGSMLPQNRALAVEKIKRSRSTRVILISFKAGSTGLNLTCCNHVILSDLWWNPALEDQAFDRAHRMGQKRDVEIYKLTVPHTVEERILQLQDGKRALAAAALSGDKFKSGNKLRLDDLVKLFKGGEQNDSDED